MNRRWPAGSLLTLIALLLLAPTAQTQPRPRASVVEYRPILYLVEGGAAPLYLYGSLHIAPADVLPPPVAAREAFARSQRLITEVVINEQTEAQAAAAMLSRMFLEDEKTLRDLLSPSDFGRLDTMVRHIGLDMDGLELMQPWAVELILTETGALPAGFSPENGLDLYFTAKALSSQLEIRGLETVEEQMNAISGGSVEEQVQSLVATLASDTQSITVDLYHAWRSGDVEQLAAIVELSMPRGENYYDRLLTRRNRVWTRRLQDLLAEPDSSFVVVGAAHLVGQDSVQRMLSERGFTVRRVLTVDDL